MAKAIKAYINANVLLWARSIIGMPLDIAAKKIGTTSIQLEAWEKGEHLPTIRQIRKTSKVYNRSLAFFYLPQPPENNLPAMKDFRRFPDDLLPLNITALNLELLSAVNRRSIAIELSEQMGQSVQNFAFKADSSTPPETMAESIRVFLGIEDKNQFSFHDSRANFNYWKSKIENRNILIFQSRKVDLSTLRGYSVFFDVLPIIGVNRKDSPAGRAFSLIHELSHIILRQNSLCDLLEDDLRESADSNVEAYCNHVAGATLVPQALLLGHPEISKVGYQGFSDEVLLNFSKFFSVSKEVILRRLLIFRRISQEFYNKKRTEFAADNSRKTTGGEKGFLPPVPDTVSAFGKPLIRLVLDALNTETITSSDFSGYLGLKLKHIDKLQEAVYG
jgi:Zn-dependent peptidase ImmA (M78 family)